MRKDEIYNISRILVCLLFSIVFLSRIQILAFAQSNELTISPAIQELSLKPGEKTSFNIAISNIEYTQIEYAHLDFNPINNETNKFILNYETTPNSPENWISYQSELRDNVILYNITVSVPEYVSTGLYIPIILFTQESKQSESITLSTEISTTIMINVITSSNEFSIEYSKVFLIQKNLFEFPTSINTQIHNNGNTYIRPRGAMSITNPFGTKRQIGYINNDFKMLYPQDYLEETINFSLQTNQSWFESNFLSIGKYTISIETISGQVAKELKTKEISFYYIPKPLLLSLCVLTIISCTVIFTISRKRKS